MSITVKFFASLQQLTGTDEGNIDFRSGLSVSDCWDIAAGKTSMPGNTLCSINLEYADMGAEVNDGDEVAFFPPVTGG